MLTLKEKMQLFKLAKKPRKQIRLRLQEITDSLNLPSLQKTRKQLIEQSSLKQQNVINKINNFKKVDKTRHYISQMARKVQGEKQEKENRWKEGRSSYIDDKSAGADEKDSDKLKRGSFFIKGKENHSFKEKTASLLQQFSFTMTRAQKEHLIREQSQLKQQQNYIYLKKGRKEDSISFIRLKNELSSLQNINNICKLQLEDVRRIKRLQGQANRMSQLAARSDQVK